MKALRIIGCLLIAAECWAAEEGNELKKRTITESSLALLIRTFPFDASVAEQEEDSLESYQGSDEVITMEAFEVDDVRLMREITRRVDRHTGRREAEQFDLVKGGVLYQKERLKLGTWGDRVGLRFLQFYF